MRLLRLYQTVLVVVANLLLMRPAWSEPDYQKWSKMGVEMSGTFSCAALAEEAQLQPVLVINLFNKGVEQGRSLLNDIFKHNPLAAFNSDINLFPGGCVSMTNAEFVLGQLWQCARNRISINLPTDPIQRVAEAKHLFEKAKCSRP